MKVRQHFYGAARRRRANDLDVVRPSLKLPRPADKQPVRWMWRSEAAPSFRDVTECACAPSSTALGLSLLRCDLPGMKKAAPVAGRGSHLPPACPFGHATGHRNRLRRASSAPLSHRAGQSGLAALTRCTDLHINAAGIVWICAARPCLANHPHRHGCESASPRKLTAPDEYHRTRRVFDQPTTHRHGSFSLTTSAITSP